jgi:hypothetical protein
LPSSLSNATFTTIVSQRGLLSSNAKGWLPWLLFPVSRHQQQRVMNEHLAVPGPITRAEFFRSDFLPQEAKAKSDRRKV